MVAQRNTAVLNYSQVVYWALGSSCVQSTLHNCAYHRAKLQGGIKGITFFASVIGEMSWDFFKRNTIWRSEGDKAFRFSLHFPSWIGRLGAQLCVSVLLGLEMEIAWTAGAARYCCFDRWCRESMGWLSDFSPKDFLICQQTLKLPSFLFLFSFPPWFWRKANTGKVSSIFFLWGC